MSLEDKMIAAVNAYIGAFEKKDLETIIDLYADDCWIEDPVGTDRKSGKEALREFYQVGIDLGVVGTLESEIRIAGNEAAFAFSMNFDTGAGVLSTRPIDIMTFNDAGKITSMRAFWGPKNQGML